MTYIKTHKQSVRLFFTLIIFFFGSNAYAQPFLEWANSKGAIRPDEGNSIAVDASGNVYTCGIFSDTIDFDPGPATFTMISANPSGYVQKLDGLGHFVWAKSIPTASALALDASGNVYVTGNFNHVVDFDPGPATFNLGDPGSDQSIYIEKLDASGNFIWAKAIVSDNQGTPLANNATAITIDGSGNIICSGTYYGMSDFDPGAGVSNLSGFASPAMFILKLNVSGNFVWVKGFHDGDGYSISKAIKTDATGNVYAVGEFQGTTDFDPVGSHSLTSVGGNNNAFLLKLNPTGNFISVEHIASESSASALAIDNTGSVIFSGGFMGTVDFDPGPGSFPVTSVGTFISNTFFQKLDATGNLVWVTSSDKFGATAIQTDAGANIYSCGNFSSGADLDPGTGTYTLSGTSGMYIQKLTPGGNFILAAGLYGTHVTCASMYLDALNIIYITGYFNGAVDFDPGTFIYSLTTGPSIANDAFVAKLTPVSTLNVNELSDQNGINIFPNPTSKILNVDLGKSYENSTFKISDITGKAIITKYFINADKISIDIDGAPGIYFLEITCEEKTTRLKVVKL